MRHKDKLGADRKLRSPTTFTYNEGGYMLDTRITNGIRLSLKKLNQIIIFVDRLGGQPEFEDSAFSKANIISLKKAMAYVEVLFKQLYQQAAAHALKKEP